MMDGKNYNNNYINKNTKYIICIVYNMNCTKFIIVILSTLIIYYVNYFMSKSNYNHINKNIEPYKNINKNNIVPPLNGDDINMIIDEETKNNNKQYEPYMRKDNNLCKPDIGTDKYYNKVDRIHQLHDQLMDPLIGHDKPVYNGKKISDIYDELTKNNAKCYPKKCLKKPYIDPYGHANYYSNDGTIKDLQWEYENECVMNGGSDGGVYGFDPSHEQNNGSSLAI